MILVCGEALIDLFTTSDGPSGPTLKATVGGSPFNVAVGLARLGNSVAFLAGLSLDYFGALLVDTLRREGVDTSLVKRSARPTPLVLVSPDAQGHPSYTFYAHDSAVQDLQLADVPRPLPASTAAIALGSYALAVEPVGTALLAMAEREAQRRVIAVDCNLRPALVGSLDSWRERIERFARCASIIKLSDEDFANGWSGSVQPDEQAAHWLEFGVKLVIMTDGPRGATAWHRSGRVTVPAAPAEVLDTVGAGDSFQAALLARLAQSGSLSLAALSALDRTAISDAMHYASCAASLTCERRGADLPRLTDMERLMGVQRYGPK